MFLTNTFLTNMDDEEQAEIQGWLEDVLGSPFPMGSTFEDCLASGARLCQVMNRLCESNASSPIDPRYTRRPQPQPQPTPGRYLSATRHMYLLDIAALSSRAPPASPTRTRTRLQLPHSLTPKARTLSQATNDSEMEALRKARRSAFQHHPVSRSLTPLNPEYTTHPIVHQHAA